MNKTCVDANNSVKIIFNRFIHCTDLAKNNCAI